MYVYFKWNLYIVRLWFILLGLLNHFIMNSHCAFTHNSRIALSSLRHSAVVCVSQYKSSEPEEYGYNWWVINNRKLSKLIQLFADVVWLASLMHRYSQRRMRNMTNTFLMYTKITYSTFIPPHAICWHASNNNHLYHVNQHGRLGCEKTNNCEGMSLFTRRRWCW